MNNDIRIDVRLPRHWKYRKLKRLLGTSPMEYLITFWGAVAEQIPNGALNGWSNTDIEQAAEWYGEPGVFAVALVEAGFLDGREMEYSPHDWAENQPWVIGAKERSAAARKAGKASAAARKEKYGTAQPPSDSPTNPERPVESFDRTPSPSPSPSPREETNPPIPPNGDDWFGEFWKAYPNKTGKGAAEKAWKKIKRPKETLTTILLAIERQKNSPQWRRNNGQYIPNPSTWLNQRRWEDEPVETIAQEREFPTSSMSRGAQAQAVLDEMKRRLCDGEMAEGGDYQWRSNAALPAPPGQAGGGRNTEDHGSVVDVDFKEAREIDSGAS